jgi:hypothetical protein
VAIISAKAGSTTRLSAEGTDSGDNGQGVNVSWWIYPEAGNLPGATLTRANGLNTEVVLPPSASAGAVHVILQAEDQGTPPLVAYRRIIIQATP